MRDYGGRPLAGMMPRVSTRQGEVLLAEMITIMLHQQPEVTTAHLRFLVQKTPDPLKSREAGLAFLSADYYQEPEFFSDRLTAVFAVNSAVAARLADLKTVLLDFAQYSQTFRMFAAVKRLKPGDPARDAALWHNRLFNRNLPEEAAVLSFTPDWKTAQAQPAPD